MSISPVCTAALALSAMMLVSLPAWGQDGSSGAAKPDPMQIARGAKGWADNCGRCHNLRDPKEYTDKDWDVIVSQMRVRANLPGQLARDIAAFLKASN